MTIFTGTHPLLKVGLMMVATAGSWLSSAGAQQPEVPFAALAPVWTYDAGG